MAAVRKHQENYPLPENEQKRLEELYEHNLLQSLPEDEFERLTSIAKREFDVEVAAVSLITDDRQYLKSVKGTNCS
ncbi:MAG: hypothetical protein ABEK50_11665 [bacterium]